MNASPTAPLIIIDKGEYCGTDISGTTATLADVDDPECGYYLLDGPRTGYTIHEDYISEAITIWRPCMAVPNDVIDKLHAAFYDMDMTEQQREAFQALETYTF
jgi:hypothetical protein